MIRGMISDDGHLWIAVPIAPRASSTGKTTNVATTGGFARVNDDKGQQLTYQGHAISVSVNATIPVASTPRAPQPAATGVNVPTGMNVPSATMPMANGPAGFPAARKQA